MTDPWSYAEAVDWLMEKCGDLRAASNVMTPEERGPHGPSIPIYLDDLQAVCDAFEAKAEED